MTITLDINPELERQIMQAAAQQGLSLSEFILQSVTQRLPVQREQERDASHLSGRESNLMHQINQSLSQIEWERYRELVEKRQAETLSIAEQTELISLSNQIEEANSRRVEYVAELARLRNTTLPGLMKELDFKPGNR